MCVFLPFKMNQTNKQTNKQFPAPCVLEVKYLYGKTELKSLQLREEIKVKLE